MENIETLRKRLRYQSHHRGTREMDLLFERFSQTIETLSLEELKQFEILLSFPDYALYSVFFEKESIPQGRLHSLVEKIRTFIDNT